MESKKISQRRMAEIIGVTHPTLGKYLTGEQIIDSEKLSLIAQYFKLPFDYFFAEEHEKLYLLFRADQPSEHLDDFDLMDIHKKFQDYITIVDFGHLRSLPPEYHLDITGRKPNNEDEIAIEKVAHEMRKMLNIEHVVPENYYKVIDQSGIHILASSYRNDSFFGASSYSPEYGSFIFVNTSEHIPEERQIFSLFHELALQEWSK
jgi:transcriptional regulator with XRE-family HTH domain